jgi:hypothetical protein
LALPADILRDLGVFSLLRVSPETSEHGIVGDAAGVAGGGSAGAGSSAEEVVPKMGSIPAPERPVILDLLDLELVWRGPCMRVSDCAMVVSWLCHGCVMIDFIWAMIICVTIG